MFKPLPKGLKRYALYQTEYNKTENITLYKAVDTVLKRNVMLKKIKSDSDTLNVIIHQTQQIHGLQDNLSIFPVLDTFQDEEFFYVVYPIADIGNLYNLMQTKPIYKQKLQICYQLIDCVAYLHSKSVMHMNLKPENIMITSQEKELLSQISDTGLALSYCEHFDTLFMAPEVKNNMDFQLASDIYSLGCVLHLLFYEHNFLKISDDSSIIENTFDKQQYQDEMDLEIIKMIQQMTNSEPQSRGTITEHRKVIVDLVGEEGNNKKVLFIIFMIIVLIFSIGIAIKLSK